jgi:hypothetical protein
MIVKATAPLFRGATRPTLLLGVPLVAFVVVTVPVVSASMFLSLFFDRLAYILLLIPIPALIVMRELTKRDDQYLRMAGFQRREQLWLLPNKVRDVYYLPPKPIRHKD